MNRFTAILFLAVLLFNVYGYQFVITYLQNQHETKWAMQLDNDAYDAKDLISVKTPLMLPYYTNSVTYERIDGAIVLDGIEYKYVKRRIYNDSLELLCLPNKTGKAFQTAKVDFIKLNVGWQTTEQGKKATPSFKNNLPEYCDELTNYDLQVAVTIINHFKNGDDLLKPSNTLSVQEQPPDAVSLISANIIALI